MSHHHGSFFHKPENALRRALELKGIGQPDAALTLLHDLLGSRRHKTWSPVYEQVMILYLDLCLARNRSREAKDGLHQYRNLSQSQAPGSLEIVIRHLLDKAEEKCRLAKESAESGVGLVHHDSSTLAATDTPTVVEDDLEQDTDAVDDLTTHQSIMLSTMSLNPEKTQRETAVVLPSIKFLWEAYRAVLDILRSNSKLERLYHAAALGALEFCRTYKRRTEFRRFCDMLRQHLGNLQKYGSNLEVPTSGTESKPNSKVRGWEGWTADSIEFHLTTRFHQLQTASTLHLYTEGFKTVEDIYNILQISHAQSRKHHTAPPKARLMATYYEKLTDLFWVSENHLFHGFAWYKYYTLCREYNKGMDLQQKQQLASTVLLSALCIPTEQKVNNNTQNKNNNNRNKKDQISKTIEDDINSEKTARMATLLGFHTTHPTRDALLQELHSRKLLQDVPDYLKKLYELLEESSDPLVMVSDAKPLLDQLKANPKLAQYVKPLTDVLLLKLLFNLSAAYHTVSLDHLRSLTDELGSCFEDVEKSIVLASGAVAVRIDHRERCLRFGSSALESDGMRGQLVDLSRRLLLVCKTLEQDTPVPDDSVQRAAFYEDVRQNLASEHAAVLARKSEIEKRKEEVERVAQDKLREEQRRAREKETAAKMEERRRLAREQKMREREKQVKIQKEMERMEKKKYLTAMGKNTEDMDAKELEQIDTAALMKEHADKAHKKKEEAERKLREVGRKLDYVARAKRIEELPLVRQKYAARVEADRARYETEIVEKAQRARTQWEDNLTEQERLKKFALFDYADAFEELSLARRRGLHDAACAEADRVAEAEAELGKTERARKRKDEEQRNRAAEAARLKAEAEERRLEEERAKKEEERKKKAAEDEKRRQAEFARVQEEERQQREEREKQERQDGQNNKGGGMGGGSRAPPRSSDLEAASSRNGGGSRYVPPSRRTQTSSGPGGGGNDRDNRDRRFGGSGGGGSGRYDDSSRGGGYGGGRYDRVDRGGMEQDRRGGGDRDRDGRGGGDRDRDGRGGGGGSRYGMDRDRDRGGGGDRRSDGGGDRRSDAPPARNSRWS